MNQFTTIRTSHSQPCSTEAYASLPLPPPFPIHTHFLATGRTHFAPPPPIPSPLFTWLVCSIKKVPIEGEVCKAGFMGLLYKWKKIFMLTKLILNCKYQINYFVFRINLAPIKNFYSVMDTRLNATSFE
jgi:hypothetical protein